MFVVCEKWVETRTDCYIDPSLAALLSHLGFGCSTGGSLMAQSPLSGAGPHFGVLSPTYSNRLGTWLYYCLTSTFFRCSSAVLPLIYNGASLEWRLGRGTIYNNHPILIFQNSTCGHFLHARLHPPHTHILQIMLKDNNSKNTKRNYLKNSKMQKS